MLLVPMHLAPEEHKDLKLLSKNTTHCMLNVGATFSNMCKCKTLKNITYNLLEYYQNEFFEQLLTNIDNSSSN